MVMFSDATFGMQLMRPISGEECAIQSFKKVENDLFFLIKFRDFF